LQLRGSVLVYRLAQGFAGLKVGHTTFRNGDAFPAPWVATHAGWEVVDREAAKAANLNALATHQGVIQRVKNGFDSEFSVLVG
jgi:hypothetical protein